jgi:hypothetical protein
MSGSNQLFPDETMREGVSVSILDAFSLRTANLPRIGLAYTLLWLALLLWAILVPGSFWFVGSIEASPAAQIMCACAILTPFLIPFAVYFPVTHTNLLLNSSSPTESLFSKSQRYWKQVLACWALTLFPLFSVYVLFVLMRFLGFLVDDLVTPAILGFSFLIFVTALTLLTSATSIGLAMSGSRAANLIAMATALSAVILPFILSELVTGARFENHLVRFVKGLGDSTTLSIFLLLLSLLVGSVFSSLHRRKEL